MSLKDLGLKDFYDSSDNVYEDFFNKVLTESVKCSRFGGKFSSINFARCAEGMQKFIENRGKMRLILVNYFSDEDIEAMQKGTQNETDLIIKNWITEFSQIKTKFDEDCVKALAWLLKEGTLEIRIIVVTDPYGKVLTSSEIENIGYLNRKLGIYHGKGIGEIVSFSGDIDYDEEIYGDWYRFDVFRYWEKIEVDRVNENHNYFNDLWENKNPKLEQYSIKTLELPQAIEQEIVRRAPKSKSEIKLVKPRKLFTYQNDAISEWKKNGCRGIFEMATGTGKTWTAIAGIKELEEEIGPFGVVIAVPSITLIDQWNQNLTSWPDFFKPGDGTVSNQWKANKITWRKDFEDQLDAIKRKGRKSCAVIILHYKSYADEKFLKRLEGTKIPLMLIADEVHNAGAPTAQKGLVEDYKYRLGLSATVDRYYDDPGTLVIRNYFGKNAITYDLERAINEGKLVEYFYYPKYLELESDELEEYRTYSTEIAVSWAKIQKLKKQKKSSFTEEKKMFNLKLARARIIKDARQKIPAFKELIDKDPKLKYTFVFCSGQQLPDVLKILNNRLPKPISNSQITQKFPKTYRERVRILQGLAEERYQVVIGIKILDEGIDVPEANNCFILESDGNSKQFIQRRGRVLRKLRPNRYKDGTRKDYAKINDFLVIPELAEDAPEEEINLHTRYVGNELRRQYQMAKIAKNSEECLAEIEKIRKKFHIDKETLVQ